MLQVVAAMQDGQASEAQQTLSLVVENVVGEDGYYAMVEIGTDGGDVAVHAETSWLASQARPAMVKRRTQW